MKYLAFDIEIFNEIPEGETDWKTHRPLGISCAATESSDGLHKDLWANDDDMSQPMTKEQCENLLAHLRVADRAGYKILTWNGLSFDFDILAEESGKKHLCAELALKHIDMMYHFLCLKGFPVGLDAVARGLGLGGKTEGMNGALAPQMWQNGEYDKVLEYVAQDVRLTLDIAQAVDKGRGFGWTAKSGRWNTVSIPQWLTVVEAGNLEEPDTSWMSEPWPRSRFFEWMIPE